MKNPKDQRRNEAFRMTGDWGYQSRKLKNNYNQLTDDDLKFEMGGENDLLRRIGARLEKSRLEVITIIQKVQFTGAL